MKSFALNCRPPTFMARQVLTTHVHPFLHFRDPLGRREPGHDHPGQTRHPQRPSDATGFIDPSTLATCVQQAKNLGWSAGVIVRQVSIGLRLVAMSFDYFFIVRVRDISERRSELDQDRTFSLVARMREFGYLHIPSIYIYRGAAICIML